MDSTQLIIIVLVVAVIVLIFIASFAVAFFTSHQSTIGESVLQEREKQLDDEARRRLGEIGSPPLLPESLPHIEFGKGNRSNQISHSTRKDIVKTQGSSTQSSKISFGKMVTQTGSSSISQIHQDESLYKCPICRRAIVANEYGRGNLKKCQKCGTIYHKDCCNYIGSICSSCNDRNWQGI